MKKLVSLLLALSLGAQPLPAGGGAPPEQEAAEEKYIALTFDDGPSGELTQTLLDGLSARGVKATFFVCGYRVEQYPQTLRRIAQEGHALGLHSCCHDYMQNMSYEQALDDLARCAETVERCCGVRARLFRPPGGLTSPALLDAAKSRGLPVILWSVDPMDWDRAHHAGVYETVVQNASPGAVILMHDLFENSVSCALRAIDTLQAQGYRFVTVPELAARAGSALTPGTVYRSFS